MTTRRPFALAIALTFTSLATACSSTKYDLENRESAVTVIVRAPAAAQGPVATRMLVTVDDRRAVDGTVRFPQGTTDVVASPVYVRAGDRPVAVSIDGRPVATGSVRVRHAQWVVVTLAGSGATISTSDGDPRAMR